MLVLMLKVSLDKKGFMEIIQKMMEGNISSPNTQLGEEISFTILQVLSIFDDSTLESLSIDPQFIDNEEIYKTILQRVIEFRNNGIETTKILEVPNIEIKEKIINILTNKEFISSLNNVIVEKEIFQKYFDQRIDTITQFNEVVGVSKLNESIQPILNNINNLSNQDIQNITIQLSQSLINDLETFNNIEMVDNIVNLYKDKINYNFLQTKFSEAINNNYLENTTVKNDSLNLENTTVKNDILSLENTTVKNDIFNNTINELTSIFSETISPSILDIKNIGGGNTISNIINSNINNTSPIIDTNNVFSSQTTNLLFDGEQTINNSTKNINVEPVELITKNLINSLGSSDILNMDVTNKEEVINNNFENVFNTINNIKNEIMEIVEGKKNVGTTPTTTPINSSSFTTPTNNNMTNTLPKEEVVNVYPKVKDVRPLPVFNPIGVF